MSTVEIVTLPATQLIDLIKEVLRQHEVEKRQAAVADAQGLSLNKAARLARRRTADVVAAMRSGALPSTRKGNRWSTSAANVRAWVEAGHPVK